MIYRFALVFLIAVSANAVAGPEPSQEDLARKSPEELVLLAEGGNPIAARWVGLWHLRGDRGFPKDTEKGKSWLRKAAQFGDAFATNSLVRLHMFGPKSLDPKSQGPESAKEAEQWSASWSEICELPIFPKVRAREGDLGGFSQAIISRCYLEGFRVEQSTAKGIALLTTAAQSKKSSFAARDLASIYGQGKFGLKKDLDKEIYWQTKALENQHLESEYRDCLDKGLFTNTKNWGQEERDRCFSLLKTYSD